MSFCRLNITTSFAKYDLVLEALPQDVIISIRVLVNTITETSHMPYKQLKYRLLSSYSPSQWLLINRLLDTPLLGDHQPSVLMDSTYALPAASARARGIAFSRPLSLLPPPRHARSPLHQAVRHPSSDGRDSPPAVGRPRPPPSHCVWDGAGPADVHPPGGGHSGCACTPAVLALPTPPPLSVPAVPCIINPPLSASTTTGLGQLPATASCPAAGRVSRTAARGHLTFTWFQADRALPTPPCYAEGRPFCAPQLQPRPDTSSSL